MTEERRAGPPKFVADDEGNIWIESKKPPRGDEPTQRQYEMSQHGKNARADKYDAAAQTTHLGPVRLREVTAKIFSPIKKGEVCRYGTTGWILRCPQCGSLIIMEDDVHKTYISRDGNYYRLTPSLVCPAEGCTWHVFATILPESVEDAPEEDKDEEDKEDDASGTEAAAG